MSKITLAPLPQLSGVIKSIITKPFEDNDLAKPWLLRNSDIPYWFSRSTFAMLAIAKWYEVYADIQSPVIWIPDYFCNASLQYLRQANYRFHFYPITNDLLPDWEKCTDQALTIKPDIFILAHYFGYPSDGKNARKFCNDHKCVMVEDAAHVLIPQQDIGLHGEFVFYSLHKLLAIPDGAVLIQRPKTKVLSELSDNNSVEVMNLVLGSMPQESPAILLWLLKRILQKYLPDFFWLKRLNVDNIGTIPHPIVPFKPLQSNFSRRLLTLQIPYINQYLITRRTNQSILSSYYFSSKQDILFKNEGHIPYIFGFRYKNDDFIEVYINSLKDKRSAVMRWPDLPPEVISDYNNHKLAIELQKTILFVPIHQSLNISAIKKVGHFINNIFSEKLQNNDYKLEWFKGSKEEWQKYIEEVGRSNLLQSYAYGKAKEETEGWKVKRGLIIVRDTIVAIFQALEKFWGPVRVIRINRGPLLISGIDDFETKYNIYKVLRKTWKLWKGKILLIAPELIETPENLGVLKLSNFRKRSSKPWRSTIIYLLLSEDELRKNLNGKWRNQLKKSEQSGLKLNIDKSDKSFFWLLDRYEQMMKDKSFNGPDVELYTNLYDLNRNNCYVFHALLDGQRVAGILIVRQGISCTYQIGWNSLEGRRVYANNLLLWNAVLEVKKRGCVWFDMGGIDEENTSGITKFKRGLGGKEYKLVGEWF